MGGRDHVRVGGQQVAASRSAPGKQADTLALSFTGGCAAHARMGGHVMRLVLLLCLGWWMGLAGEEPLRVLIDAPDARAGGLFVALDLGLAPHYHVSLEVIQRAAGERELAPLDENRVDAALIGDGVFAAWSHGSTARVLAITHRAGARVLLARADGGIATLAGLVDMPADSLPAWGEGVPVDVLVAARPLGLKPSTWSRIDPSLHAFLDRQSVVIAATWRDRAQLSTLGLAVRPLCEPVLGFGVALVVSQKAWHDRQADCLGLRDMLLAGWSRAKSQPGLLVAALAARADNVSRGVLLQEADLALTHLAMTTTPTAELFQNLAQSLNAAGVSVQFPQQAWDEPDVPTAWGTVVLVFAIVALLAIVLWQIRWNRRMTPKVTPAGAIQRSLLSKLPDLEGWEIGVHYRPHADVSGDFYICAGLRDHRALIVVGDVSGHGVRAALVASAVAKAGEVLAGSHTHLKDWLIALDAAIAGDLPRGLFVTLVAVALDPWSGAVECARAGHPPAYLIANEDDLNKPTPQHEIGPIGLALGLSTHEAFAEQVRSESLHLAPGSDVLLFTDGLTEVFDRSGREYGVEGLFTSIARHRSTTAQVFVDAIARDAIAHAMHGPDDDLTALVIRRVRATVIADEFRETTP